MAKKETIKNEEIIKSAVENLSNLSGLMEMVVEDDGSEITTDSVIGIVADLKKACDECLVSLHAVRDLGINWDDVVDYEKHHYLK